jgi:hypothetical protein
VAPVPRDAAEIVSLKENEGRCRRRKPEKKIDHSDRALRSAAIAATDVCSRVRSLDVSDNSG